MRVARPGPLIAMRSEHPELQELMLWQSGELASDESAIVAVHLDNCETCRQGREYALDLQPSRTG